MLVHEYNELIGTNYYWWGGAESPFSANYLKQIIFSMVSNLVFVFCCFFWCASFTFSMSPFLSFVRSKFINTI